MDQSEEIKNVLRDCGKVITALAVGGGISYDRLYMIDLAGRIKMAIEVVSSYEKSEDTIAKR